MKTLAVALSLLSAPAIALVLDAYTDSRDCYSRMGKYEEIAVWSDLYHRSVAVTPPDYAKVFLPTSGY
jgi:hypothetical protein